MEDEGMVARSSFLSDGDGVKNIFKLNPVGNNENERFNYEVQLNSDTGC